MKVRYVERQEQQIAKLTQTKQDLAQVIDSLQARVDHLLQIVDRQTTANTALKEDNAELESLVKTLCNRLSK